VRPNLNHLQAPRIARVKASRLEVPKGVTAVEETVVEATEEEAVAEVTTVVVETRMENGTTINPGGLVETPPQLHSNQRARQTLRTSGTTPASMRFKMNSYRRTARPAS
jgi:hypothetical protein